MKSLSVYQLAVWYLRFGRWFKLLPLFLLLGLWLLLGPSSSNPQEEGTSPSTVEKEEVFLSSNK